MITIKSSNKKIDSFNYNRYKIDPKRCIKSKFGGFVECFSSNINEDVIVGDINNFVIAASTAFSRHKNFAISPDDIWMLILQGFAIHVNQNAEELRSKFVDFKGKKTIIIREDDFVLGQSNPWDKTISKFSAKIEEFIGDKKSLIVPQFSTTTDTSMVAFEVSLMDCVQQYFEYKVCTLCGIPNIHLFGTKEDWQDIVNRVEKFSEYGLDWWVKEVIPILNKFVSAFDGDNDFEFWNSFFNENSGSGTHEVSGHITKFFPYIEDKSSYVRNSFKTQIDSGKFPTGFSKAPFTWEYYSSKIPMEFVSGFIGYSCDAKEHVIKPEIGWAVINKSSKIKCKAIVDDEYTAKYFNFDCVEIEKAIENEDKTYTMIFSCLKEDLSVIQEELGVNIEVIK